MKEQDELAGIIEKEVKKSNLVDLALPELAQIEKNAKEFRSYSNASYY